MWLNAVGIGLTLWEGQFEEDVTRLWLRWCDSASALTELRTGQVIPTGAERADESNRKAQKLAERLRAMGVNPDEI